jgi:hypothetical protein
VQWLQRRVDHRRGPRCPCGSTPITIRSVIGMLISFGPGSGPEVLDVDAARRVLETRGE